MKCKYCNKVLNPIQMIDNESKPTQPTEEEYQLAINHLVELNEDLIKSSENLSKEKYYLKELVNNISDLIRKEVERC